MNDNEQKAAHCLKNASGILMKINHVTNLLLVFITCGAPTTLRLLHKQVAMFLRYGLSFVVMLHSYDYISLFVSFVALRVRLGNLFQRIASIYDRF